MEKSSLLDPISKYSHRFFLEGDTLEATDVITHEINTTDDTPIFHKQYRQAEIHNEEISKQTKDLLKNKITEDSDSPYNSPVWIVPKKPDPDGNKRWRMVIDFRQLNEKTVKDAYPLPNITHILDQLGGAQYFSTLDLAMGFHQIKMHPKSKAKTAFSTPFGHYHFNRMPFGLKNAPATFQRLMDRVLSGLQGIELFVYMDDIVIYASSLEEHTRKLLTLLERLDKANLTLQPEKCFFLRKEVCYLGHTITRDGVKPDPKKVEAVRRFPQPRNAKNIKQFLGLAGYYRRFIPDFSSIAKPLSYLLKKNVLFKWTESQNEAFNKLKNILCTYPLLQYPDFGQPFIVSSDASNYGLGGVLSQELDGKVLPIAYASRTLSKTEVNYSTIEKELLAILFSVETFRPYLYGRKFTLETDHRPLVWLHNVKNPNSKLIRWRLRLNEYDYVIVYKKGTTNSNADALSRNPCEEMQTQYDVEDDTTLNEELDPLDSSFHRVHEVLISNQTPVTPPSRNTLENTDNDVRIENAFSRVEHIIHSENKFSCQIIKKKVYEPDSSEEEFKTATEESGDEQVELFVDAIHEEGYPSGSNYYFDANMSLGPGAIPSTASRDCTSRTEGEALMDFMSESTSPGAIPSLTSRDCTSRTCADDDRFESDGFFTEIRKKFISTIESDNENSQDSFEYKDPLQTNFVLKSQKRLIFKPKNKKLLSLKENQIANESTYPYFPISQDQLAADKDETHNDPLPPNYEFTCIKVSRDKLYMRNDNLLLFIPADCKLTTETGRELIQTNRLIYTDIQNENPENLEVGNVLVIKYEDTTFLTLL